MHPTTTRYRPSPSALASLVGEGGVDALGRCASPAQLSATLAALARLGYTADPHQLQVPQGEGGICCSHSL